VAGASSWALASSCNATVSNVIGQQRHNYVFKVVGRVVTLSTCIALAAGTIIYCFKESFLSIYTNNPELLHAAIAPLIVVLISNVLLAASTVVFNAVAGTGSTRVSMLIELSAVAVYISYIYIVIERNRMSLALAWGSEFVYWLFLLCCSALYLRSNHWKSKVV
jgi:multidrug resistance protein, MATE family